MLLSERHVQMVWGLQLLRRDGLRTEDGRSVVVEFPGLPGHGGGPDFRGARMRLDGVPVAGDVELHLTTAGWTSHGHAEDPAYDGVVLHVALRRDREAPGVRAFRGQPIPELVLEPALERSAAELVEELRVTRAAPPAVPAGVLEGWGDRRFERRIERLRRLQERTRMADLFVREVFIGLGYRHNKASFAELARLVPRESLRGLAAREILDRLKVEARRLPWRTQGVRPANHPRRRLEGAARWLGAVGIDAPHRPHFERPDPGLFDPDGQGWIGPERSAALVANVVLPMAILVGTPVQAARARRLFRTLPCGARHRKLLDGSALLGWPKVDTLRREWGVLEYFRNELS